LTRLWDFALAAYARPGVEAALLALQDEHDQCVSYLIWAGWAALEPRVGDAAQAVALAADVEAQVLRPIRSARRALRAARPGLVDAVREALREQVKEAELAAERLLLESLEAVCQPTGTRPSPDLEAAFLRAASAWPVSAPADALRALWRMFAGAGSC
jgi:uncharacterized protein (TIGR02444 family)